MRNDLSLVWIEYREGRAESIVPAMPQSATHGSSFLPLDVLVRWSMQNAQWFIYGPGAEWEERQRAIAARLAAFRRPRKRNYAIHSWLGRYVTAIAFIWLLK